MLLQLPGIFVQSIDYLLLHNVIAGILYLPVHDGFVVPAAAAEMVRKLCCGLTKERLGVEPRFKITHGIVA